MPTKSKIISILICLYLFNANGVSHADTVDYRLLKPEYFASVKHGTQFSDTVEGNKRVFKVVNTKTSQGVKIKINGSWEKHGIFYSYSSGKLKRETIFNKGKKDGLETKYRSSGKLFRETNWVNGVEQGEDIQYHKNGNIDKKCNMENGKAHGTCIWNDFNGTINTERTYVKGEKHGIMKGYRDDGSLSHTEMFENNKKVGKTIWAK